MTRKAQASFHSLIVADYSSLSYNMQIAEYRKRLDEFHQALNSRLYGYCSGQDRALDLAGIYSDFSDLHGLDTFREAQRELGQAPDSYPSRRKSLEKIRGSIIDLYLDARCLGFSQEIASFDSRTVHLRQHGDASLAQVPGILAKEPDAGKRRRWNEAYVQALTQSEAVRRDRFDRLHESARELGFGSYREAYECISGIDYRSLSSSLDAQMDATEAEYLDALRDSIEPALGISVHDLHRCDIGYWLSTSEPAAAFGREGLVSALDETIARLGIQPERKGSITLDLEARPLKHRRAFCLPLRIPFEIRITMLPAGGYGDYAALFHESGHAHHFAWTSADLPAEHRIQGDRALTEAYAFLLERVTRERLWLQQIQQFPDSGRFLGCRAVHDAYNVRRRFALFKFEMMLHAGAPPADAPAIYSDMLTRYTGVRHDPEYYLFDVEDGFYSADYLRAWIFEAMLREHLRIRFGLDWFFSRAAGNFLKEIWETGQLYSADELSREIGTGALDPQVLVVG